MENNLITKKSETEKGIFDYSQVDKETGEFMKQATENIFLLREKTKKALGEQFFNVQKKLAGNNQYNGYFQKWFTALGFKKDFVYTCINYYNLLVVNSDNKMIQDLSFSKAYQITKLKDVPELQKEVIEKAPLKDMKVKQVAELVKEVKDTEKLTDELIERLSQEENKTKSNLSNFIKVTESLIYDFEQGNQELQKEDIEKVLDLIEKVKNVCPKKENK